MNNPSHFRLPVHTAIAYTAKWRELQAINPTDPRGQIRAFTLHRSEIVAIMDELQVDTIRLYLGINKKNRETLILVGVNEKNEDMVEYKCKGEDDTTYDETGTFDAAGTYDFTYPCPDTCASGTSVLNED